MELISVNTKLMLEDRITDIINKDNINKCTVEFLYEEDNGGIEVYIITYNPIHKNSFLYGHSWGITNEVALDNFINKLNHPDKKAESTYTVVWSKVGGATQVSYFSGSNMFEVLEKFFHGKNKSEFIIFELKLNPMA